MEARENVVYEIYLATAPEYFDDSVFYPATPSRTPGLPSILFEQSC